MIEQKLQDIIGKYVPGGVSGLLALKGQIGEKIIESFSNLAEHPLTITHINQILHLSYHPGVSDGFFRYYFIEQPPSHPYNLDSVLPETPDLHPHGIHSLGWQLLYPQLGREMILLAGEFAPVKLGMK